MIFKQTMLNFLIKISIQENNNQSSPEEELSLGQWNNETKLPVVNTPAP